ncbi:MAG: hypothetical protein HC848_06100 [Limnobacter sp.]|nr:hypothetical protein [Limnobacter sp.]
MKKIALSALMTLGSLFSAAAYAGAGANVNVCVNLVTKPAVPLVVNAAPGSGASCMYDTGNSVTFTASNAGVTCGSVGYVEAKASSTKGDFCATSESKWPVGYSITGTSFSGSTQSVWHTSTTSNNSIDLENYASNTVVCNSAALCSGNSTTWNHGTQGPLYIIFQPQAQ